MNSSNLFGTRGSCTCGFADVPAELPCEVHGTGELTKLLWDAIQRNDLKAVATLTKFINGMRDENEY